jgi:asparagine synthase (glutamine-hydrolysing)
MPHGFLVLPDLSGSEKAAQVAPFSAPQVIRHPSGRPWLMGHWKPEEITSVITNSGRVAVVGICPITAARLAELAGRLRVPQDIDPIARMFPGSFCLVVAMGDWMRIQGSASGLRRIYHAHVDGIPVAADRPDLLGVMTGAGADEQALATRVACGLLLPPPLDDQSMWSGVQAVPPGQYLAIETAQARQVPWWRPPEPVLPLAPGAAAVREALSTAMAGRLPPAAQLSADMSGGMDSTSLCFLAAREQPGLMTFRLAEADVDNEDAAFASHAARSLSRARHMVTSQDKFPAMFADPARASAGAGRPYPSPHTIARSRHTAQLLAGLGSRWHLSGFGGDELFGGSDASLHGLARRHPVTAIRYARGYRALYRWHLAATVAGMARGGDIASWWRAQADNLTAAPPAPHSPAMGWGTAPLRARAWVTGDTIDAARATLRGIAEQAQPLAPDRGQHQILTVIRASAAALGQLADIFAEPGITLDLPYLDDQVIEAALAVQLHERASPWRYKPLLAEAVDGIVPGALTGRSTKGEFSEDMRVGLRRNRAAVLDVFADSELAARGMIDIDRLRSGLLAPHLDLSLIFALQDLLACEIWLREVAACHPRRSDAATSPS